MAKTRAPESGTNWHAVGEQIPGVLLNEGMSVDGR